MYIQFIFEIALEKSRSVKSGDRKSYSIALCLPIAWLKKLTYINTLVQERRSEKVLHLTGIKDHFGIFVFFCSKY